MTFSRNGISMVCPYSSYPYVYIYILYIHHIYTWRISYYQAAPRRPCRARPPRSKPGRRARCPLRLPVSKGAEFLPWNTLCKIVCNYPKNVCVKTVKMICMCIIYIYMCVCACVRIIMYIWYPSIQWSIIFCYWLHALRHMQNCKKKLCHHYVLPCFHKRLPALRRHADRSSTAVQLSYLPLPHGVRHGSNDLHTQCGPKNGPQIRRTSPQMNIHENYTTRIARLQKTDLNCIIILVL